MLHEIDICIMKTSKSDVTISDFLHLLDLCKKNDKINSILKTNLKIYFPEDISPFHRMSITDVQGLDNKYATVTPAVCFSNGDGFIAIHVEGENFMMEQFTVLTSALLLLSGEYGDVRIVDAQFFGTDSQYLIKFSGDTDN